MKERPILFNGEMVRAILDGRKTQTRRVVKFAFPPPNMPHPDMHLGVGCPLGQAGDRLWVRETFVQLIAVSPAIDEPVTIGKGERLIEPPTSWVDDKGDIHWHYDGVVVAYRADSDITFCDGDGFCADSGFANSDDLPRWRPSIHMPRWASRITLEITNVRVERLQEIKETDALAEGIYPVEVFGEKRYAHCDGISFLTAQDAYHDLWNSIYKNWDENPWVWVIEFKRVSLPTPPKEEV